MKKDRDSGYISCSIISEDAMELGGIFGLDNEKFISICGCIGFVLFDYATILIILHS